MPKEIASYIPEIIATRRAIHRRPELGWTEFETTALIAARLSSLGIGIRLGREIIAPEAALGRDEAEVQKGIERALRHGASPELIARMEGFTGCVGILETGRPGPCVAFRFDIDALPIAESRDPGHLPEQQGFASELPGLMHACGHDAHAAVGLGLARWLADNRDSLRGRVKLIFQPAEEGTRGANAMVEAGVVDDADWLFAAHVGTSAGPGEIMLLPDGYLATVKFDADFTGLASHAGSAPEKGRSALLAAANAAVMLNAIPRTSQGDTRMSVGVLRAGTARNITPQAAHMECEVRGTTHEANEYMFARAKEVIEGCAAACGVSCRITRAGAATTLTTTQEALRVMEEAGRAVPGARVTFSRGAVASEDCTLLMRRVFERGGNPGYFCFGCRHKGHHRPDFDIQDTENLRFGFEAFVNIARRLLAAGG